MTKGRLVGLALVLALFVSACGTDGTGESTGPTVADRRFGGLFTLTALTIDGQDEAPLEPIVFEIDAEFGSLAIDTACGTLLGSFSFFDDGRAGITIAGGSQQSCGADVEAQTGRLLAALGRIDAWSTSGVGFNLQSPMDDMLSLKG